MNIKQLMVTFFIALLAGGEIGARVLTDKFVYSQDVSYTPLTLTTT